MRTCTHVRHVYTRTRTHRRRQMAFVHPLVRGKTCRRVEKREKERYFVRGITFVNRKGDYAGYAGGHYKRCLWFVSKYNVPAAIFAMRTNGRYFHFLWSLFQSHDLPRKNSLSTRIILSILLDKFAVILLKLTLDQCDDVSVDRWWHDITVIMFICFNKFRSTIYRVM